MTVTIPINEIDWVGFYNKCKDQGVKIRSRFIGIYLNVTNGKPFWMARYQGANGAKFLGRFEFTKIGEEKAAYKYSNYIESLKSEGVEFSVHPGAVRKYKTNYWEKKLK